MVKWFVSCTLAIPEQCYTENEQSHMCQVFPLICRKCSSNINHSVSLFLGHSCKNCTEQQKILSHFAATNSLMGYCQPIGAICHLNGLLYVETLELSCE